jgi:hypothetical protein
LLVLLLAVSCFCGGIGFERERRRRNDKTGRPFQCSHMAPDRGRNTESGLFFSTVGDVVDSLMR